MKEDISLLPFSQLKGALTSLGLQVPSTKGHAVIAI